MVFAVVLVLFVYSQRGHAQPKQPTAGDSIQDAIKASASDHAQPAAAQQWDDDTSLTLSVISEESRLGRIEQRFALNQ